MRQVNLVKTPYQIVMNMEMVLAKLLTFPGHLRTVQGGVTYVINVGWKTTIKFRMHLYNENWLVFYFLTLFCAFLSTMASLVCSLSIEIWKLQSFVIRWSIKLEKKTRHNGRIIYPCNVCVSEEPHCCNFFERWKLLLSMSFFHLLTARCIYSDWFTISDCSATCGSGYKREVRSFTKVNSELAVAKHCNEDLKRLTSCKLDPCKFKFLGVLNQLSPFVSVFVCFTKLQNSFHIGPVWWISKTEFLLTAVCCILSFETIAMYRIVYCNNWIRKDTAKVMLFFFFIQLKHVHYVLQLNISHCRCYQ